MIELKQEYTIHCNDIAVLTGKHWGDFNFTQSAENDSYQILRLDDIYLEQLKQEIEYEREFEENRIYGCDYKSRLSLLKNEYELIKIFREEYGLREQVLVYITW